MSEKMYKASDIIGILLEEITNAEFLRVAKRLSDIPSAVVRCKDCRHFRFHDGTFGKGWMCFESNTARHGDDYCSRGERSE